MRGQRPSKRTALVEEREHALLEVAGPPGLALEARPEGEVRVEVVRETAAQGPLDDAAGRRGAGGGLPGAGPPVVGEERGAHGSVAASRCCPRR